MKATFTNVAHLSTSIIILIYAFLSKNILTLTLSLAMMLIYYYEYKSFEDADKSVTELRVTRMVKNNVCSELEYIEIVISIANQSSRGIPRAIVVDIPPKYIVPEKGEARFDVTIPQKSSIEVIYRAKVLAPGAHDFNELIIGVSDVLGYFYSEYRFNVKTTVVALPLYTSTRISIQSLQRLLSINILGKAIGGVYNIANIRDYIVGDDVRRIIWKIYARIGKPMVREDYGETRARLLLLIDMKKYLWGIGKEPNTLAHIQLRYARSLIEYISKSGANLDVAICSGITPKVIENVNTMLTESLYRIFSILDSGGGCDSPIGTYIQTPEYLGRSIEDYDAIIFITNPITLILEGPVAVKELLKEFDGKLIVVILGYDYGGHIETDKMNLFIKSLAEVVEGGGARIEIVQEGFEATQSD